MNAINYHQIAGILAGIITLLAYVLYIRNTAQGKTKPARLSWFIWSWAYIMQLISYYEVGAGETIWVPIIYTSATIVIALLSIKNGVGGFTTLDKICLTGAFIGTALWFFASALLVLIWMLFVDIFAVLPSAKYYLDGNFKKDDMVFWTLILIGIFINLFAVEKWTFEASIYPIYMLTTGSIIFGSIFWSRYHQT